MVGPFGYGTVTNIAFDTDNDVLYGYDETTDTFMTIDETTGAGTPIAVLAMQGSGNFIQALIYDMTQGGALSRLTFEGGMFDPFWSPDGREVGYRFGEELYAQAWDGSGSARLLRNPQEAGRIPEDVVWTPDGRWLVYRALEQRRDRGSVVRDWRDPAAVPGYDGEVRTFGTHRLRIFRRNPLRCAI